MGKFVHITLEKEASTGYVDYKPTGEKHCENCKHFLKSKNECKGPHMLKLTNKLKLSDGNVMVNSKGLCNFWK
jgi:hypothetical protein